MDDKQYLFAPPFTQDNPIHNIKPLKTTQITFHYRIITLTFQLTITLITNIISCDMKQQYSGGT